MSDNVTRYKLTDVDYWIGPGECEVQTELIANENGELVRYDDFSRLLAENAQLRAERDKLFKASDDAVTLAIRFGGIDGSHHKAWVIDQVLRLLLADKYAATIDESVRDDDGKIIYTHDEGIAP